MPPICRSWLAILLFGLWGTTSSLVHAALPKADVSYAVVVSTETHASEEWKLVVETLREKHQGRVVVVDKLDDALAQLQQQFPTHVCFVANPLEVTTEFVAAVHQLTRRIDDDPYTDCLWGILTGYDAANALTIARQTEPLTIRKVGSGTEVALDRCEEGQWFCELVPGKHVSKTRGEETVTEQGPSDSTQRLVDLLNEYHADLFITSGHATERDWQIGFRYRNGQFVCRDGRIIGRDLNGKEYPVDSSNPKVYLPIGNCLMGHIDSRDAMALAFMNSAGVHQMVGYTVPTWFGYGGWGLLDYFVEQPGRYTLAEAFFVNHQALLHKLETEYPKLAHRPTSPGKVVEYNEGGGLLFDRDVVAFYGDPAWEARMADRPLNWKQTLTVTDGLYTFTLTPLMGEKTFQPVNINGAQRGGRPIVQLLPQRLKDIKLIEGENWKPLLADNFLLVPNPKEGDKAIRIRFTGQPIAK
ncbi:MAG: hypothetical protein R3C01_04410 [Planctomycetaceae bacterium]